MTLTTNLSVTTFFLLFAATVTSAVFTGSSLQWTVNKGFFEKKLFEKANQYNLLVVLAASSSLVETLLAFWNNLTAPNFQFWILCWVVSNWIVMTNTSILLVSQRLSLTFRQSRLAWSRLLWINYLWFPCSLAIAIAWVVKWSGAIQSAEASARFDNAMKIVQPVQIATLGIIEFCLSGAFIVQMWKFKWGPVERHSILMLVLVGCCDLSTIFMNLFIGDLESILVKGLVYSIRIRLEVNVLCTMVDYLKASRGRVSYGTSTTSQRRSWFSYKSGQFRSSVFGSNFGAKISKLSDEAALPVSTDMTSAEHKDSSDASQMLKEHNTDIETSREVPVPEPPQPGCMEEEGWQNEQESSALDKPLSD